MKVLSNDPVLAILLCLDASRAGAGFDSTCNTEIVFATRDAVRQMGPDLFFFRSGLFSVDPQSLNLATFQIEPCSPAFEFAGGGQSQNCRRTSLGETD